MKYIPYELIAAAQNYDSEAIEYILKHFEGFIAEESKERYESEGGRTHFYLDDDLRYLGQLGLYAAIFRFQFRDPPEDFAI